MELPYKPLLSYLLLKVFMKPSFSALLRNKKQTFENFRLRSFSSFLLFCPHPKTKWAQHRGQNLVRQFLILSIRLEQQVDHCFRPKLSSNSSKCACVVHSSEKKRNSNYWSEWCTTYCTLFARCKIRCSSALLLYVQAAKSLGQSRPVIAEGREGRSFQHCRS